jgi:hypothetical protein
MSLKDAINKLTILYLLIYSNTSLIIQYYYVRIKVFYHKLKI